eukprot:13553854-Heterocapsa_arctica.AAC.1
MTAFVYSLNASTMNHVLNSFPGFKHIIDELRNVGVASKSQAACIQSGSQHNNNVDPKQCWMMSYC